MNALLNRYEQRNRRKNTNLYALFAIIAIAVSGFSGLMLAEWQYAFAILCVIPLLAFVPLFNRYGKDTLAVAIVVHASNFAILTFVLGYGYTTGSHAFIFPLLVAISYMNPLSAHARDFWTHMVLTTVLHLLVFAIDRFVFYDRSVIVDFTMLEVTNFVLALAITIYIIFQHNLLTSISQQKLSNQLEKNAETLVKLNSSIHEKEVLLAEVHHRVKNNLAIISGMLNLRRHIGSKGQHVDLVLQECANRVVSMALVHEKLYKSGDLSNIPFHDYLDQLCNDIRDSLIHDKEVQLRIETEEIYLSIEKAIPAGLIVNEIITNSIKHAFKDSTSGKIDLRLSKHTHSVYLLIHDNGVGIEPIPKGSNEESLGFMLVDSLVNQLDGTYEFVNHNGTSFVLRFPI